MAFLLPRCIFLLICISTTNIVRGQQAYYDQEWISTVGDTRVERSNSIAVDKNGNSYVTGHIQLQNDDPSRLMYLVKFDSIGQKIWDQSFNLGLGAEGWHIVVHNDTIIVASDIKIEGIFRIVLSKHKVSNGDLISSKILHISRSANVLHFVPRPSGGYFMTGRLNHSSLTEHHGFIAKLDNDGNVIWMENVGEQGLTVPREIHYDANENLYIVGLTSENLFGIQNPGRFSMFVAKYDSTGQQLWGQLFGGAYNNMGYTLSLTPGGYILVGGSGNGRFDQPDTLTNRIMYVIRLHQETGEIDRTTYYNPGGDLYLWKLIATNDDSFIFTGWTNGPFYNTIHFNADVAVFGEARDWKLIPQSFKHIQSTYSYSFSMQRMENGDVYWVGHTFEGLFDDPQLGSSFDIYVAKLTQKQNDIAPIQPWVLETPGIIHSNVIILLGFGMLLILVTTVLWNRRQKVIQQSFSTLKHIKLSSIDDILLVEQNGLHPIRIDGREGHLGLVLMKGFKSERSILNDEVDAILLPNHPSPDYVRKIRNVTLDKLETRLQAFCPLPDGSSYIIRTVYATDRRKSEYQFNPEFVSLAKSTSQLSATA